MALFYHVFRMIITAYQVPHFDHGQPHLGSDAVRHGQLLVIIFPCPHVNTVLFVRATLTIHEEQCMSSDHHVESKHRLPGSTKVASTRHGCKRRGLLNTSWTVDGPFRNLRLPVGCKGVRGNAHRDVVILKVNLLYASPGPIWKSIHTLVPR